MGVATAAVVAHLAGAKLMPGLCRGQRHAVFVNELKRERLVGRNLREKTCVGIAVWIEGLRAFSIQLSAVSFALSSLIADCGSLIAAILPHRNLAKDAQSLECMVRVSRRLSIAVDVRARLLRDDANRVDLFVDIEPGVRTL